MKYFIYLIGGIITSIVTFFVIENLCFGIGRLCLGNNDTGIILASIYVLATIVIMCTIIIVMKVNKINK